VDPEVGGVLTDGQDGASAGGPTVRRILLGTELRRLRDGRGISRYEAGHLIRASESKISRMELGKVGFKERDVADLLTLYGVVDENERAALLTLAREANEQGWWHAYADLTPNWFQSYLGMEAAASLIRTYEVQFVPGLLQTEDYARAVIRIGYGDARDKEINRRVQLRTERQQQTLSRPDPPQLWAVVDEAVLRRTIGGLHVMRTQLEALAEASTRPNIRIQVIPFRSGEHAAAGGAFTILRFPEQDIPDVVYIEHLTSALYLDKRQDVTRYAAAIERLFIEAEPPARTAGIVTTILRDLQ
jgi:hypothetical protein